MNCPDLLAEIYLRVPANTRSRDLLGRRYHSTNFDFNSPFSRFIRLGNRVASGCDLFFDGLHQAGVKTEDVLHGFTHAQYDRKRIVHNTVASPVEHGRRGCPGTETFW
ncbi:hypothetical protein J6590_074133 [Homalodisca vitripennis]|nr:hypothetical protein J6590_074133 [Homalodisca vitripennis]